ncbi:MAG: SMP-30/gluconolactonase/LRE family protein [Kiloniellaceae bacterium]
MPDVQVQHWRFERLSDARARLGESPLWSARENAVWWVDVTGRKLLRSDADSGRTRVWRTPEEIGFVVATASGLAVGMESGLFLFDAAGGGFSLIVPLDGRNERFNDAATDAAGRLWAATCDIDNKAPLGRLLRIDPDLTVNEIASGLMTPNGLAVDSDSGRLYLSDSHPQVRCLWWLPFDPGSGSAGGRQLLANFREIEGRPDGGTLDAEGTYWIAGVDGAVLHGFSPGGERRAEVTTPMASPTKFAFGGKSLEVAFLTSKTVADDDAGGFLYKAVPGPRGRRESRFGYRSA